jgi:hypothetical protein
VIWLLSVLGAWAVAITTPPVLADDATPTATATCTPGGPFPPTPGCMYEGPTMTATATPTVDPLRCVGDCDDNRAVLVNEVITSVNIALGGPLNVCPAADCPQRGEAFVSCTIEAVNNALNGCPAALPTPTPTLGPARCRSNVNCDPSSQFCLVPGGFIGCGICYPEDYIDQTFVRCTEDAECSAPGQICAPLGAVSRTCDACSGPNYVCMPGCTGDGDCDSSQSCEVGHCVGRPCVEGTCSAFYDCAPNGRNEYRCARRRCGADDVCQGGTCVNGECYDSPGRCEWLPS